MIAQEIAKLTELKLPDLQDLWIKYFDAPPLSMNKEFYVSRIAYRMQELEYGGLATSIKLILIEMAEKGEKYKRNSNLPPIGTRLVKEYKGKEHIVTIIKDGFEFNGKHYKTLSTIARLITGHKISGKFFFQLSTQGYGK